MKKFLIIFIALFLVFGFLTKAETASQHDVLINEIAWMGSTNSATDEWLELFNSTSSPVDISGWVLKTADNKLKINLKGAIPAKGFYLLERTNDDSVPGISADLIYKGDLSNSGQYLLLYDNLGNIIDEVNYATKWPAGDNKTKQTMERVDLASWQTSQSPNGTPKAKNSPGAIITPQLKTPVKKMVKELPKQKKSDSNINVAGTTAAVSYPVTLPQETPKKDGSGLTPLNLFLTILGIILVGGGITVWKYLK